MKLGDVAKELRIDLRKITDYALNPENPVGADKAKVFARALGYTKDNYEALLKQIQDKVLMTEAIPTIGDQHGQRYRVDLEIIGVAGQQAVVRTGWMIEPGTEVARLITFISEEIEMLKPELLDVVELLVDRPEQGLSMGARGAIVDVYPNKDFEVEFTNSEGETLATLAVPESHFLVVWRSATKVWVPIAEQLEVLAARLSVETQQEILDFARFIYSRKQVQPSTASAV